jgi:D-serine deaminase-like pyridoxal phosphate-dependent protein
VADTGLPLTAALASLDTPALLVDLDLLDANIARVTAVCREHGVDWRPHIKGNKTPAIVARAIAAGAIGVTCAKLGEAEVMAEAGVRDILIANQIVGADKIARLLRLCDRADPIVAIDDPAHVAALAAAGPNPERPLRVVVEVDLGMNRAGVPPGPAVVALADAVARHPGLRFVGVMAWESHALLLPDPEKENTIREALARLVAAADLCREAGHAVSVVSCGGTGTFPYCAAQPGITEVQSGGVIFGDVHYREHYRVDVAQALTVLASVTSRPTPRRIILDAGRKAMPPDIAVPAPLRLPPVQSLGFSAEHVTVELTNPSETPAIGDKVEFIVGYGDMTVFLHDEIVGHRGGVIEAIWPVLARGKLK